MKPSDSDEEITAYDVATIAVHWIARHWSQVAPGVATRLREIADRLSQRSQALREQKRLPEDALDPFEDDTTPTEQTTQPYGSAPQDDD